MFVCAIIRQNTVDGSGGGGGGGGGGVKRRQMK